MGNERRRFQRVPAEFPFRLVNEQGKEEGFELVDLSEAGARIRCGHAIGSMTRVEVAMVLPGHHLALEEDVRLDTTGVIVWCHRVESGMYDTGVFFPDLGSEERDMLRAFVQAVA